MKVLTVLPILISCLFLLFPLGHGVSSLGLDGIGKCASSSCFNRLPLSSQILTTTEPNDLIVVIAECGNLSCDATITSVTDSSGLTFTQRLFFQSDPSLGASDGIWEYYAIANSPLNPDNITIVWSLGTVENRKGMMQAFAIHGANMRTIFDPSLSFPISVSCQADGVTDCSVPIGAAAHDFIIAITAINDSGICTASTGFTELPNPFTLGGSLDIDYRIVNSPQNNLVFTCSQTDPMAIAVDAISFHGPL